MKALFHIANALVALTGIIHLLTQVFGKLKTDTIAQNELINGYTTVNFEMPGGQLRTLNDISTGYSYYSAFMFICISLFMWINPGSGNTQKMQLLILIGTLGVLLFVTYKYLILPPFFMLSAAFVLYIIYFIMLDYKGK